MEKRKEKRKVGQPRKDNVQMLLRVSPEFKEMLMDYHDKEFANSGRKPSLSKFIIKMLEDYMGVGKTINKSFQEYRKMDNSEFE